jgi:hypothetical protein
MIDTPSRPVISPPKDNPISIRHKLRDIKVLYGELIPHFIPSKTGDKFVESVIRNLISKQMDDIM